MNIIHIGLLSQDKKPLYYGGSYSELLLENVPTWGHKNSIKTCPGAGA